MKPETLERYALIKKRFEELKRHYPDKSNKELYEMVADENCWGVETVRQVIINPHYNIRQPKQTIGALKN